MADRRSALEDNFMKFEVTGGVYLDDQYERFGPPSA